VFTSGLLATRRRTTVCSITDAAHRQALDRGGAGHTGRECWMRQPRREATAQLGPVHLGVTTSVSSSVHQPARLHHALHQRAEVPVPALPARPVRPRHAGTRLHRRRRLHRTVDRNPGQAAGVTPGHRHPGERPVRGRRQRAQRRLPADLVGQVLHPATSVRRSRGRAPGQGLRRRTPAGSVTAGKLVLATTTRRSETTRSYRQRSTNRIGLFARKAP